MNNINEYLEKVSKKIKTGLAKEHTFRGPLEEFFQTFGEDIEAVNEPARTSVGAPDFAILKKNIPIGYVEAKDITSGILDKEDNQKQIQKYFDGGLGENFIFTDYLSFRFFRNGEEVARVEIAKVDNLKLTPFPENFQEFQNLMNNFISFSGQTIKSSKKLSEIMSAKARTIKTSIWEALKIDEKNIQKGENQTKLYSQFLSFKNLLIHDLDIEQFSDIYAQTITYGLFAARLNDKTLHDFSRIEAAQRLPKSNPFLKRIFTEIGATDFDERISWIIDDLVQLFLATNVKEILTTYKKTDPLIHFYEDFLADYDPKLRKARGVWYTPKEAVSFIVRAVDEVLENDFGLVGGLTNTEKISQKIETQGTRKVGDGKVYKNIETHKVQILDPATGTGTFLVEAVNQIYEKVGKTMPGNWNKYVENDLLPRINGFEIMMASYAMAHLRLDLLFSEQDIELKERLNIYLTNSLEDGKSEMQTLFSDALTSEAEAANKVKSEKPIMCIIGNPPYSAESQNNNPHIMDLLKDYKMEPGGKEKLKERNPKWINDDYVKFIRLSENFIQKNNEGVLGFITNHGYLDNPTFRGMRWHLLKTFDKIYVIDLHGNARKKEKTPTGETDQNIFDIMAGVSIVIGVKNNTKKDKLGQIFHTDVWGKRDAKNSFLEENNISNIQWNKLENKAPYYFFVPKNYEVEGKYNEGISVKELFVNHGVGITTAHDKFVIDSKEGLIEKFNKFKNSERNEDKLHNNFNVKKKKGWDILNGWDNLQNIDNIESFIKPISYRPFDNHYIFYENKLVWRTVEKVMKHFLLGENIGLVFRKQQMPNNVGYYFISNNMMADGYIRSDSKGGESIASLYLYQKTLEGKMEKIPNFDKEVLKKIEEELSLRFDEAKAENSSAGVESEEFSAENLLDYIYAVLHSPKYRETYKEFLKIDFPKIPFKVSKEIFWKMVELGNELRKLHLLESKKLSENLPIFHGTGDNIISKKIKFEVNSEPGAGRDGALGHEDNKVWINETQYFDGVPEISWNFFIGGYQPAQKYLKDRKEREITFDEIQNYQKIIVSLSETEKVMNEINKIFAI